MKRSLLGAGAASTLLTAIFVGTVIAGPRLILARNNPTSLQQHYTTPTPQPMVAQETDAAALDTFLENYQSVIFDEIAQELQLSSDDFQSRLASGESLALIAQEQNVSYQALQQLFVTASEDTIAQAANSGDLTQEQSNQLYTELQMNHDYIDHILHGHFDQTTGAFMTE